MSTTERPKNVEPSADMTERLARIVLDGEHRRAVARGAVGSKAFDNSPEEDRSSARGMARDVVRALAAMGEEVWPHELWKHVLAAWDRLDKDGTHDEGVAAAKAADELYRARLAPVIGALRAQVTDLTTELESKTCAFELASNLLAHLGTRAGSEMVSDEGWDAVEWIARTLWWSLEGASHYDFDHEPYDEKEAKRRKKVRRAADDVWRTISYRPESAILRADKAEADVLRLTEERDAFSRQIDLQAKLHSVEVGVLRARIAELEQERDDAFEVARAQTREHLADRSGLIADTNRFMNERDEALEGRRLDAGTFVALRALALPCESTALIGAVTRERQAMRDARRDADAYQVAAQTAAVDVAQARKERDEAVARHERLKQTSKDMARALDAMGDIDTGGPADESVEARIRRDGAEIGRIATALDRVAVTRTEGPMFRGRILTIAERVEILCEQYAEALKDANELSTRIRQEIPVKPDESIKHAVNRLKQERDEAIAGVELESSCGALAERVKEFEAERVVLVGLANDPDARIAYYQDALATARSRVAELEADRASSRERIVSTIIRAKDRAAGLVHRRRTDRPEDVASTILDAFDPFAIADEVERRAKGSEET